MHRKDFLHLMALLPLLSANKGLAQLLTSTKELPYTEKMPVFFVGHLDFSKTPHLTPFTKNLRAMGEKVSPAAILVISAHWLTLCGTLVNTNKSFNNPEYPSTGSPETARLVMDKIDAMEDATRNLDHAAWSVLRHISPDAKVPVLEISIDMEKPLDYHYNLARKLSELRNRGVLIIGSGNIVHNLELSGLRFWTKKPYDWALEFDQWAKARIDDRDIVSLCQLDKLGSVARNAVPTMDHYIPMLYCLAMCDEQEEIVHTYEEVSRGLSFRCFRIG